MGEIVKRQTLLTAANDGKLRRGIIDHNLKMKSLQHEPREIVVQIKLTTTNHSKARSSPKLSYALYIDLK